MVRWNPLTSRCLNRSPAGFQCLFRLDDITRHTGPRRNPQMASLFLGANRNKRSTSRRRLCAKSCFG